MSEPMMSTNETKNTDKWNGTHKHTARGRDWLWMNRNPVVYTLWFNQLTETERIWNRNRQNGKKCLTQQPYAAAASSARYSRSHFHIHTEKDTRKADNTALVGRCPRDWETLGNTTATTTTKWIKMEPGIFFSPLFFHSHRMALCSYDSCMIFATYNNNWAYSTATTKLFSVCIFCMHIVCVLAGKFHT